MTYWIRLIVTIVSSFFKPSIKWDDEVVQRFRVWFTEADMALMNNSRYFYFTELSKYRHFIGMGMFKKIMKLKWQPLSSFQVIKFKKGLKRFQKFTLKAKIIYWDDYFVYQQYNFVDKDKVYAMAIVKACFLSPKGKVSTKEMFNAIGVNIPDNPPKMISAVSDMYSLEKNMSNIASLN